MHLGGTGRVHRHQTSGEGDPFRVVHVRDLVQSFRPLRCVHLDAEPLAQPPGGALMTGAGEADGHRLSLRFQRFQYRLRHGQGIDQHQAAVVQDGPGVGAVIDAVVVHPPVQQVGTDRLQFRGVRGGLGHQRVALTR